MNKVLALCIVSALVATPLGCSGPRHPTEEEKAAAQAAAARAAEERSPYYVVDVKCTNCGHFETIKVPKGKPVFSAVCSRCQAWIKPGVKSYLVPARMQLWSDD